MKWGLKMDFLKLNEELSKFVILEGVDKSVVNKFIIEANKYLNDLDVLYELKEWDTCCLRWKSLDFGFSDVLGWNLTNKFEKEVVPSDFSIGMVSPEELDSYLNNLRNPQLLNKYKKLFEKAKKEYIKQEEDAVKLKQFADTVVKLYPTLFTSHKDFRNSVFIDVADRACIYFKSINATKNIAPLFDNKFEPQLRGSLSGSIQPPNCLRLGVDSHNDSIYFYIPNKQADVDSLIDGTLQFLKSNMDIMLNNINNFVPSGDNSNKKAPKWHFNKNYECLYARFKDTSYNYNEYGDTVEIHILRADEWETGEYTDFEQAQWFPQIEPDVHDMWEGNEYDISPNRKGSCSLQDALKVVKKECGSAPTYEQLVKYLKFIESWVKTGTLDSYLQKHESEFKGLCG